MKSTIKITALKSATVENQGQLVGIELKSGFFGLTEQLTPDQAQALGDALLRAAEMAAGAPA